MTDKTDMFLPGHNLLKLIKEAGFDSVKAFWRYSNEQDLPLNYRRLIALTNSRTNPDYYEINAIPELLKTTMDCWMRGECDTTSDLTHQLRFLKSKQREIILRLAIANVPVVKKMLDDNEKREREEEGASEEGPQVGEDDEKRGNTDAAHGR